MSESTHDTTATLPQPNGVSAPHPGSWGQRARQLGSNSLIHFLLIGGLCFALAPAPESQDRIAISAAQLKAERAAQRARLGQTTLTAQQRAEVDQRVVHDALLFREAQRLGLGHGDAIIRQRMVQKMLFLALRLAGATQVPKDDQLRRWFQREQARGKWRAPAAVSLMHIYFRRRDNARITRVRRDAIALMKQAPKKLPPLGDAFPMQRQLPKTSLTTLTRRFGDTFANTIATLQPDQWSKAIASRYGWHLVRVLTRSKPRKYRFAEVKAEVRFQWVLAQKRRAKDALLRRLYKRYRLQVAGYSTPPFIPPSR